MKKPKDVSEGFIIDVGWVSQFIVHRGSKLNPVAAFGSLFEALDAYPKAEVRADAWRIAKGRR